LNYLKVLGTAEIMSSPSHAGNFDLDNLDGWVKSIETGDAREDDHRVADILFYSLFIPFPADNMSAQAQVSDISGCFACMLCIR